MGCDIHMAVEVRDQKTGVWTWLRGCAPCGWCKDGKSSYDKDEQGQARTCYWCKSTRRVDGFECRNYDTFGILAGVRSDDWSSIAAGRGLPVDMSTELARAYRVMNDSDLTDEERDAAYERAASGEHSHTWCLLSEVLVYPWDDARVTQEGYVTLGQFARWDGQTSPTAYCGDVGVGRTVKMTATQARQWLDAHPQEAAELLQQADDPFGVGEECRYVAISWGETARQSSRRFIEWFVPALQAGLPAGTRPEDVRLVMSFDS